MSDIQTDEECVSKQPWREVISRSLKLFTFGVASEGGRSVGRVVFYVILALVLLVVATFVIDSITGWFSGWFSFWPFNDTTPVVEEPAATSWWPWAKEAEVVVPEPAWYCTWNPLC